MNIYNNKSFTLIELLVVISIISILSGVILVNVKEVRERAKITKAKIETRQLAKAVRMLELDTGQSPGHIITGCNCWPYGVYMDSCEAGIQCTDGNFPNWRGPYMNKVPKDPWGTYYYYDADYFCGSSGTPDCDSLANVRAVVSLGPNKTLNSGGDDIMEVLCVWGWGMIKCTIF